MEEENQILLNKSCITCKHFAWWSGDYCCMNKLKILQQSFDGKFNVDMIISIRQNKNCKKYSEREGKNIYLEKFKEYLENNEI